MLVKNVTHELRFVGPTIVRRRNSSDSPDGSQSLPKEYWVIPLADTHPFVATSLHSASAANHDSTQKRVDLFVNLLQLPLSQTHLFGSGL